MAARNLASPAALLLLAAACSRPEPLEGPRQKIVDVRVVDATAGDAVPAGYAQLLSLAGDSLGGNVNMGIWNDTAAAHEVRLVYRAETTDNRVGIAELHVASTDAGADAEIFGAGGHDAVYGAGGCTAGAADLNAATCKSPSLSEWYSGWCAFYFWDATCGAAGTPLFLHFRVQGRDQGAIRCLVVGDEVSVDPNQPAQARRAHLWWGPPDANQDGAVNEADADWVLARVRWVKQADGSTLVNLNRGTRSFARIDWYDCGLGQGYDNAWIHAYEDAADAQYLGTCPP